MENKKYAVVTGASQGIGKAIASELASRSYNLILLALPSSGLKDLGDSLQKRFNIHAFCLETDLGNSQEIDKFSKWIVQQEMEVEVWINNAGIGYQGPVHKFNPQFFDNLLNLNVKALVMLSLVFVKELKKKKRKGYLLNIGSIASFFSLPNKTIYSASKSFVLNFSRSLNQELKKDEIQVSCLCPGPVKTNKIVSNRINGSGKAKYFTITPDKLAKIAIDGLFSKKEIIVPSFANKLLHLISLVIPQFLIILVTREMFSKESKTEEKPIKHHKQIPLL